MLPGYPKVMTHPAFVKGVAQEVWPRNYRPKEGEVAFAGTSDRFPEVTVTNPDQQAWHESRGYTAVDGSTVSGHTGMGVYQEYPKWIQPPGSEDGEQVLVASLAEESALMGHNTPGVLGSPPRPPMPAAPKRRAAKKKPQNDKMRVSD
jgi:hypothetical protein